MDNIPFKFNTKLQQPTNIHHSAKKVNIQLIQTILNDTTLWFIEIKNLLEVPIENFGQKISSDQQIISDEMEKIKVELQRERNLRIYKDFGKSINTTISFIQGIDENQLRDEYCQSSFKTQLWKNILIMLKKLEAGKTSLKKFCTQQFNNMQNSESHIIHKTEYSPTQEIDHQLSTRYIDKFYHFKKNKIIKQQSNQNKTQKMLENRLLPIKGKSCKLQNNKLIIMLWIQKKQVNI